MDGWIDRDGSGFPSQRIGQHSTSRPNAMYLVFKKQLSTDYHNTLLYDTRPEMGLHRSARGWDMRKHAYPLSSLASVGNGAV